MLFNCCYYLHLNLSVSEVIIIYHPLPAAELISIKGRQRVAAIQIVRGYRTISSEKDSNRAGRDGV